MNVKPLDTGTGKRTILAIVPALVLVALNLSIPVPEREWL